MLGEKPMLKRMCQQRGAAQVAEACSCLEPIKDFKVECFKRRFLSHWSWQQHFAAAHTPQNTSEEHAGLILQSMVAASETVARFWMVPCLLLIRLPVVESTVQWRTHQRLPPQYSQWSRNLPHQSKGIHEKNGNGSKGHLARLRRLSGTS